MNYIKVYNQLISKRKNEIITDGYYERHHILPKSMGGGNNKDNIVILTAREHFIAHWLLWRAYRTPSMAYAFNMMTTNKYGERYCNSRGFEEAKQAFIISRTGKIMPNISKALKGNILSEAHKAAISKSSPVWDDKRRAAMSKVHKGIKKPDGHQVGENNSRYGTTMSDDTKMKISANGLGRKQKRKDCPSCNKSVALNGITRHQKVCNV